MNHAFDRRDFLALSAAAAGASLLAVVHGQAVELCFSLPEEAAVALRARLGEAGQGRIEWLPVPDEVA